MFTLDPMKLLLVVVVALVLLGPDKLPAIARRVGSLMGDLESLRRSLREQAQRTVDGLPIADELHAARSAVESIRRAADPQLARQALYRAAGLDAGEAATIGTAGGPDHVGDDTAGERSVPGSIDLRVAAPHLLRTAASPSEAGGSSASDAERTVSSWQPRLFDVVDAR